MASQIFSAGCFLQDVASLNDSLKENPPFSRFHKIHVNWFLFVPHQTFMFTLGWTIMTTTKTVSMYTIWEQFYIKHNNNNLLAIPVKYFAYCLLFCFAMTHFFNISSNFCSSSTIWRCFHCSYSTEVRIMYVNNNSAQKRNHLMEH